MVNPVRRRATYGVWARLASHSDDALVRAEPFDAIELALKNLWRR